MRSAGRPGPWAEAWARFRDEPYRLLFPAGALLGLVAVGHWTLFWAGFGRFQGPAHALAQAQGFLFAFVAGFLMTMIPRRLEARRASTPELAVALAMPAGVVVFAFSDAWILAEACALIASVALFVFAVKRMRASGSRRRMPDAFVLLPMGLATGAVGAILIGAQAAGAPPWAAVVGRGLVQEAQYLLLILGAGHMILPLLTGRDAPPDGEDTAAARRRRWVHVLLGAAIVATVVVERLVPPTAPLVRLALLGRAALFIADAALCMHGPRWPRVPGLHRRMAWLAFWLVPAGPLLAALVPARRVAMLHVGFVGGFGLLVLAVGAHVIAAHGGLPAIVSGSPWTIRLVLALSLVALALRVGADFRGPAYWAMLGAAGLAWVAGLVAWMVAVVPTAIGPPRPPAGARDLPVIPSARHPRVQGEAPGRPARPA